MSRKARKQEPDKPLRLDLGCGPNPREGFLGVDSIAFNDRVMKHDLTKPWPWKDGSVAEIHSSHFVEHLTALERVHFWNEVYRVLKPHVVKDGQNAEGFATIVVPNWSNDRAYGDFTHQWPPMSAFCLHYLDSDWRATNAPHNDAKYNPKGYTCNLTTHGIYTLSGVLTGRNDEYKQNASRHYINANDDMIITVWRKD